MNAERMISLTDYCLAHDIAPEEMEDAFNAAIESGYLVRTPGGEWLVLINGGRETFADYVAQRRTNTDTEMKGN